MKAAVIVFPGSNCHRDLKVALAAATGRDPDMVWHGDSEMPPTDLIAIPGGYSYGDYLRPGAMAATSPIMREVVKKAAAGTPVVAICNGFQVVTEAGLLPGALLRNANQKFICRDVYLKIAAKNDLFVGGYGDQDVVRFPIAHMDGNFFTDQDTLAELQDNNQIAFRYATAEGEVTEAANPNGSLDNIAGIYNKAGNVLGLMPHPERLISEELGGTDGRRFFDHLVTSIL